MSVPPALRADLDRFVAFRAGGAFAFRVETAAFAAGQTSRTISVVKRVGDRWSVVFRDGDAPGMIVVSPSGTAAADLRSGRFFRKPGRPDFVPTGVGLLFSPSERRNVATGVARTSGWTRNGEEWRGREGKANVRLRFRNGFLADYRRETPSGAFRLSFVALPRPDRPDALPKGLTEVKPAVAPPKPAGPTGDAETLRALRRIAPAQTAFRGVIETESGDRLVLTDAMVGQRSPNARWFYRPGRLTIGNRPPVVCRRSEVPLRLLKAGAPLHPYLRAVFARKNPFSAALETGSRARTVGRSEADGLPLRIVAVESSARRLTLFLRGDGRVASITTETLDRRGAVVATSLQRYRYRPFRPEDAR